MGEEVRSGENEAVAESGASEVSVEVIEDAETANPSVSVEGQPLLPGEDVREGGEVVSTDQEVKFESVKHDAETASTLAYMLFWLLAGTFVTQYATVTLFAWLEKPDIVERLSDVFNTWLPLVSSFFGAAATYYFTREKKR
ncbi:MAG: hypothetical protein KF886_05820 [Candidatus Hydrogenedentes bacterium]|nr:hypothetical protein [Candidatus Hydrogenedentota bacterium]